MADTVTSQNIDLSSWDALYNIVVYMQMVDYEIICIELAQDGELFLK
jgi:hypothetical protein